MNSKEVIKVWKYQFCSKWSGTNIRCQVSRVDERLRVPLWHILILFVISNHLVLSFLDAVARIKDGLRMKEGMGDRLLIFELGSNLKMSRIEEVIKLQKYEVWTLNPLPWAQRSSFSLLNDFERNWMSSKEVIILFESMNSVQSV